MAAGGSEFSEKAVAEAIARLKVLFILDQSASINNITHFYYVLFSTLYNKFDPHTLKTVVGWAVNNVDLTRDEVMNLIATYSIPRSVRTNGTLSVEAVKGWIRQGDKEFDEVHVITDGECDDWAQAQEELLGKKDAAGVRAEVKIRAKHVVIHLWNPNPRSINLSVASSFITWCHVHGITWEIDVQTNDVRFNQMNGLSAAQVIGSLNTQGEVHQQPDGEVGFLVGDQFFGPDTLRAYIRSLGAGGHVDALAWVRNFVNILCGKVEAWHREHTTDEVGPSIARLMAAVTGADCDINEAVRRLIRLYDTVQRQSTGSIPPMLSLLRELRTDLEKGAIGHGLSRESYAASRATAGATIDTKPKPDDAPELDVAGGDGEAEAEGSISLYSSLTPAARDDLNTSLSSQQPMATHGWLSQYFSDAPRDGAPRDGAPRDGALKVGELQLNPVNREANLRVLARAFGNSIGDGKYKLRGHPVFWWWLLVLIAENNKLWTEDVRARMWTILVEDLHHCELAGDLSKTTTPFNIRLPGILAVWCVLHLVLGPMASNTYLQHLPVIDSMTRILELTGPGLVHPKVYELVAVWKALSHLNRLSKDESGQGQRVVYLLSRGYITFHFTPVKHHGLLQVNGRSCVPIDSPPGTTPKDYLCRILGGWIADLCNHFDEPDRVLSHLASAIHAQRKLGDTVLPDYMAPLPYSLPFYDAYGPGYEPMPVLPYGAIGEGLRIDHRTCRPDYGWAARMNFDVRKRYLSLMRSFMNCIIAMGRVPTLDQYMAFVWSSECTRYNTLVVMPSWFVDCIQSHYRGWGADADTQTLFNNEHGSVGTLVARFKYYTSHDSRVGDPAPPALPEVDLAGPSKADREAEAVALAKARRDATREGQRKGLSGDALRHYVGTAIAHLLGAPAPAPGAASGGGAAGGADYEAQEPDDDY